MFVIYYINAHGIDKECRVKNSKSTALRIVDFLKNHGATDLRVVNVDQSVTVPLP